MGTGRGGAAAAARIFRGDGNGLRLSESARARRPIEDLIDGLKQLGCNVECTQNGEFGGCPPVVAGATGEAVDGGTCAVSGRTSSQFLSALLLASPLLARTNKLEIQITDELISQPYVQLTIDLMARGRRRLRSRRRRGGEPHRPRRSTSPQSQAQFGVVVDIAEGYRTFTVKPGQRYTNAGLPEATYVRCADMPRTGRGDAAAATRIFRGDESRRRLRRG